MKSCSLLVGLLAIGSLMAANEHNGDDKDLKALQGTWRLVAGEIGGRKMTSEELNESKLVLKGTITRSAAEKGRQSWARS